MTVSHDDSEITYYDELGVAPNATQEQIRDAFRLFVRLLHPDQQTDLQLKEIAENQMRKLNRIYDVLSDPDNRRRYDEILSGDFAPPIILNSPAAAVKRQGATLAWGAAIVVSAGLLIWLASDNTPTVQSRGAESSPAAALNSAFSSDKNPTDQESGAAQISRLRSDLRAVTVERDAAIQELNKLRGNPDNRNGERADSKSSLTMTELPSAAKLPELAGSAVLRNERPAKNKLAGSWFYTKPPERQATRNPRPYEPEYTEVTITEDGGIIHGRYRSRVQVINRAMSPDVNFTFSGTGNGSQCNCRWTGAGGSKGDLTLKLTSDNSMRIDWTASEFGSLTGPKFGTAVLTRRLE
jgi:curved DNA-binding protein CbpA